MSNTSVARNAALLISGTTVQKIIAFFAFTFIARWVGVEVTGQYFFAISVTSVFVTLTDLGMTPVLIRATAQRAPDARELFTKVFRAKLVLIPFAIACSLMYGWFAHPSRDVFAAIIVACGVLALDACTLPLYGWLRGHRDLQPETIGMFCTQFTTAVVGLVAAWMGYGVIGLALSLLMGSAVNAVWSYRAARRTTRAQTYSPTHMWTWKRLAVAALPFALAGLCVKVYSYADTLLIQRFWTDREVGFYAVAYKLTYAFQFVPLAFVGALYPGMSSAFAENKTELTRLVRASLRLMAGVSIPLVVWLSCFAPVVIRVVYGQAYEGSVAILRILPWVLIPIFLDFPIGSVLNASHKAHLKTASMAIAMVVNVVANALFIPRVGPVGGAVAGIMSFTILAIVGVWFAREHLVGDAWGSRFFKRVALSTVVFGLCGYGIVQLPLVAALPIAFLATCTLWAVSGFVEKEELEQVLAKLQRLRSRV